LPVIKADAYGHGTIEVACQLERMKPVRGLCVGVVSEAVELRQSGLKSPLLFKTGPSVTAGWMVTFRTMGRLLVHI